MSNLQLEAKVLIEKAMAYALKLRLHDYRRQFLEIWDTVSGRFTDRKTEQIKFLQRLNQTEVVKRLTEILEQNTFNTLGIESIFMGDIVIDNDGY